MESRRIAALAVVLAAALIFVLSSSALGCLPEENGECDFSFRPARIGNLEGDENAAPPQLQSTMRVMKSDLLAFADGTPNLSWRARERAQMHLNAISYPAVPAPRGMSVPSVRTMPDSDLAHIEMEIIVRDAPSSLIQARRLSAVTQEIAQREQQRAIARTLRLANLAKVAPKAPKVVAVAPAPAAPPATGSADPYNAPAPAGVEVYIAPRTTVWYTVNDGFRRLTMWIDANGQTGLSMAIYGPDQPDVWSAKPVGRPGPGEGRDFFWTGRSAFKGNWRIKLTNDNDFAVPYTFTAMSVSDKNGDLCRACHGNIEDEWDRCEHEGSFCQDLKDQFRN